MHRIGKFESFVTFIDPLGPSRLAMDQLAEFIEQEQIAKTHIHPDITIDETIFLKWADRIKPFVATGIGIILVREFGPWAASVPGALYFLAQLVETSFVVTQINTPP